jgi:hypothetical protein
MGALFLPKDQSGGEAGIRTRGAVSRSHALQACSFNHSDTSPDLPFFLLPASATGKTSRSSALDLPFRSWRIEHLAERPGFEPGVHLSTYTRLAGEHLRPTRSPLRSADPDGLAFSNGCKGRKRTVAEGVGFEPTSPGCGRNGFQDRRLQPLGHPSPALLRSCPLGALPHLPPQEGEILSSPPI